MGIVEIDTLPTFYALVVSLLTIHNGWGTPSAQTTEMEHIIAEKFR